MSSYNQSLQSNNTSLQAILNLAKQLPLAGGQVDHSNEDAIISKTISGSYTNSKITNLRNYAFYRCANVSEIHLPTTATIGSYAFTHCTNLSAIELPVVETIPIGTFGYCQSLTTISFPMATQINENAFNSCLALSSLYLGASTMCALTNSNAFASTPFTGYSDYFSGTPRIYVPSSLIATYQSATNWTYYSSYFSVIESSLITFTIEDVEYQAEEGMTWGEWVESEYNTEGYIITDYNEIGLDINNLVAKDVFGNSLVYVTEPITDNAKYYITFYG